MWRFDCSLKCASHQTLNRLVRYGALADGVLLLQLQFLRKKLIVIKRFLECYIFCLSDCDKV